MRFRLYPTAEQEVGLLEHASHARLVWNLALEQRLMYRPTFGPTPNYAAQSRQLTEARHAFGWLGAGVRDVQEQALRDLDRTFQNWWKGRCRRPTWRKQGQHESFRVPHADKRPPQRLTRRWGAVLVPKVGRVRFRWTRDPRGAKSYTVSRDAAGRWWVAFTLIPPPIDGPGTGEIVGLDRGVAVSATTSAGGFHSAPSVARAQALRARRQQKLARCRPGSNRRSDARRRAAVVSARTTDRRKDWVEKLSTDLARSYDLIVLEDLRVPNMVRKGRGKRGLNRSIYDQGWGLLLRRLTDKAPGRVVVVNPAYTSQTCAACGHVASENRESQVVFRCVSCGHSAHADVNAAVNIAARHAATARGRAEVDPDEARSAELVA